jgi:hypothetical protein
MYSNAYEPKLVHVGIVQQNSVGDVDCLENYCQLMSEEKKNCFRENISVIKMKAEDTRGVVPTRFLVSTLFEGEEFFLQIDSHTIFIEDWSLFIFLFSIIIFIPFYFLFIYYFIYFFILYLFLF